MGTSRPDYMLPRVYNFQLDAEVSVKPLHHDVLAIMRRGHKTRDRDASQYFGVGLGRESLARILAAPAPGP